MGSTVVYGRGRAVVVGTGMDTEMGKIAGALTEAKEELTPLQVKLDELSHILTKLVIVICVVIFAVDVLRHGFGNMAEEPALLLNTFMVAVSLAVAAIPEGLVAVVTIVLVHRRDQDGQAPGDHPQPRPPSRRSAAPRSSARTRRAPSPRTR